MIADQVNTNKNFWLRVAAILYVLSISWPVHFPTLQYVIRERELPIRYVFGQPIHALAGPIMNIWGVERNCAGVRLEECALTKAFLAAIESDRQNTGR